MTEKYNKLFNQLESKLLIVTNYGKNRYADNRKISKQISQKSILNYLFTCRSDAVT